MDSLTRSAQLICIIGLLALGARGASAPSSWALIQNAHFEIYSQAGDTPDVRASLLWFEQLRAFFAASGLPLKTGQRVRVIGFRSVNDYNAYRLRPTSDAYYVGTDLSDTIVMPSLDPGKFGIAAHEYAHAVLHAATLNLPAWLNEGLAEFFSTVKISNRGCQLGGEIRSHSQTLRDQPWLPLFQLLATSPVSLSPGSQSSLFYAQTWALAHMLLVSHEYHAHLPELIASLTSGENSATALTHTYGKSLDAISNDLHAYLNTGTLQTIPAPGLTVGAIKGISSQLSPFAAQTMLGQLLLASGELARAETLYRDLARQAPHNPDVSGALGTIALRQGDSVRARLLWKLALEQGITDANLCYRYALLAEDAGQPLSEFRPALERAIALNPAFDDARFKLALLASNAADYPAALKQLQAMQVIAPTRAFGYWLALSFAQDQLGQHADAKHSALQARHFASSDHERAQATQLAYVADTELTVQFTRDANGNPQVTTTRVPRGTQSWNPFVEPQDHMRHAEGQLRTIECTADNKIIGVAIETSNGPLTLAIPDTLHVLITGATEFTCGPQPPRSVTVDYAAATNTAPVAGILRGMALR